MPNELLQLTILLLSVGVAAILIKGLLLLLDFIAEEDK